MKVVAILLLAFCGANADKIIGGSAASSGQFPSIVFQAKNGYMFCGGTIISANRVLSAAHCQERKLAGLTVTGGTTSLVNGGQTIAVIEEVVNSGYKSNTLQNDIMILKLGSSFTFSSTIAAAALPETAPDAGTDITVAGWGDTDASSVQAYPDDLQFVDVKVIATSTCNGNLAYNGEVLPGMICMGNMLGGEDSCQGDSGGPAYLKGSTTVAGITSWGYGCAQASKPGVYTDVAYFKGWINENM